MKVSLRLKITFALTILLAVLIFVCWFLNKEFLDDYYLNQKTNSLSASYFDVSSEIGSDTQLLSNETVKQIERIEAANNVNIYIISAATQFMGRAGMSYVYPIEMDMQGGDESRTILRFDRYRRISDALQKYIFGIRSDDTDNIEILTSSQNNFDIFRYYDSEVYSSYVDLVGMLDNGYMIFIRANYENIQESAEISSRFLAILGAVVIVIGSIGMLFFTKSLTKPILELADISDRMASLDFSKQYEGKRSDELGRLGRSINSLSNRLEQNITELKTANIELERDIAQKSEIDEMRKEFLSNISHELKTPIALIQGYAEGLQENINDGDEEARNYYCEVIVDEAQKMNSMVKKLMSLNEIEFGSGKLNLEHFDIIELTRTITSSFDILAKSSNAKLIFNEYRPIYVWADAGMIEEVITNYLSNAFNHLDDNKIVDISFKETSENKIRVSVFNTGKNVPDESLDKIWDKFYKVDKSRSREYGGSGIGLSIVKAIMDLHQEGYGVKNHTGGVEFWFELDMKAEN